MTIDSVTGEPAAAQVIRDLVTTPLLGPIAGAAGADRPEPRAALCCSQVVGLVMARLVVRVQPLAAASHGEVAAALGPVLQHYLTGPLGPAVTPTAGPRSG